MDLTENLLLAWRDRNDAAVDDVKVALSAPGLFKPEWAQRAFAQIEAARIAVGKVI